jgi:Sulfotransferase family
MEVGRTLDPEEGLAMDPGRGDAVFLVGPARSGTSLLYKALCLHPEVAYVSNWVARFPGSPGLSHLNALARRFPSIRRRAWFGEDSNAYVYGARRRPLLRFFPMPVEGEPVYAGSGVGTLDELRPEGTPEQRAMLKRSFDHILEASGGKVMVNKRIGNNRRIPLLARAFPGARFIALVRDGRGVALSLSKVDWWSNAVLPWYGSTPEIWAGEGRDPWEACARNWVEDIRAMETGLSCVPQERVFRQTYESFVQAPLDSLYRIAGFAGLSGSPEWGKAIRELSFPNGNEAWRSELSAEAIRTITKVQRELLEEHGYDV